MQEQYDGINKKYDKILQETLNVYNMEQCVNRLREKNDCFFGELESLIMENNYGK